MELNRWPNNAQNRDFRNNTNENWDRIEGTYNNIVEKSNQAIVDSSTAKEMAKSANKLSEDVQEQLNTIVINGDSSVEAAQGRIDTEGKAHDTLKERLDTDFLKNAEQIRILSSYTVLTDSYPKLPSETDDTARLKRAISDLPDGGKFIFTKGIMEINEALNFKSKKNITIEILGTIKQAKHGYCGIEIESCKDVIISGNGKIQGYGTYPIRNFNPDGTENSEKTRGGGAFATNRKNGDPGTIPFGGGWEGNTGYGVLIFEGSENIRIKDIEIFGFNYSGVGIGWTNSLTYNKNIIVTNCNIHHCQDNGIAVCKTYGVNIDSNQIYNTGHTNATVNDTHITNGYGITLLYWNETAENVVISNNNIKSCSRKGIDAHACKNGLLIANNMIEDCYVYGIALPNNSPTTPWSEFNVVNNIIRNSGLAKYYLVNKDTCCGLFADITVGANISNNTIFNSGKYGILVFFKNYNQQGRNSLILNGNTVIQNNTNAERGINVYADYLDAYANISHNSVQSDITIKGIYVGYLKSANINGNTAKTSTTTGSGAIGLQAINVSDGSVTNNSCTGESALSVKSVVTNNRMFVDNSNICNGAIFSESQIKEIITNAFLIQKRNGSWTITNNYNPSIKGTLSIVGNVFKVSFNSEFKVLSDVSFTNGPIKNRQIFAFALQSIGDNYIEFVAYDKDFNDVILSDVVNETGFTISLNFLWKSL